jgi:putative ABC transport system ATP-binding protein
VAGVQVSDLVVEFAKGDYMVRPLDGFSMSASDGELVLLLGPSGCGKTTLLSCLAGILTPKSGSIEVDGAEVVSMDPKARTRYRRTHVGIVFQAFNLVPSLTARQNVAIPMRAAGATAAAAKARATSLLESVGLGERMDHRPGALSGGQMQRVAIARALALDPPLLIADEPTAALDHVQVETVLRIIRSLTDTGRTVIVSTHDQRLLPLADRIIDMSGQPAHHDAGLEVVHLQTGEVLFKEGAPGSRLFRVEQGRIDLDRNGNSLASLGPGSVFGEMAAMFQLPRSATATAAEPSRLTSYSVEEFTKQFGGGELRRLVSRFLVDPD